MTRTAAQIRAELDQVRDRIDQAYWTFTRSARGKPPSLVVPLQFQRMTELKAELATANEAARSGLTFYLGSPEPSWLESADVPLFVSHSRLSGRKSLPRASAPWALDSGGFTELSKHGTWTVSARDYAAAAQRYQAEIGLMYWAAPQDWMCEPSMLERTGLDVETHQRRTLANYLELRELAPDVPWVPVLQGWTWGDYQDHAEAYVSAGVELAALPRVGIGSVCRRESTTRIATLLAGFASEGLRLHGFGVKKEGLRLAATHLASADSMAWSENARRNPRIPGHTHKSCSSCMDWALQWRSELVSSLEG
jgi:hypothetical protein